MASLHQQGAPDFVVALNGKIISTDTPSPKGELKPTLQEDLWPSTLSPIRFLPPCWSKRTLDAADILSENGEEAEADITEQARSDEALTSSDDEPIGGKEVIERPRALYQNYSLPVTETESKGSSWHVQGYQVQSDSQLAPALQPDYYNRLSLPVQSTPVIHGPDPTANNTFADSLGLLTETVQQLSHTKKKPRLEEQQQLSLNTNVPNSYAYSPYSLSGNTSSFDFTFSAYSDAPSSCSTITPQSTVFFASTPLSSVGSIPSASSLRRHSDFAWFGNRSRTTSSPRLRPQSSSYSVDISRRRMSNSPQSSLPQYVGVGSQFGGRQPVNSTYTSPQLLHNHFFRSPIGVPSSLQSGQPVLATSGFANPDLHCQHFMMPEPIASQTIPRTLRSDIDPDQTYFEDFSGLSEPPDILSPLKDVPLSPPPQDMMPSDPTMIPHEQDLRFENDLYTPKWVRGHGNKREGWCGICKPGRWLVLKNSAFWYDKSFSHGISAATGQAIAAPKEIRRSEGSTNIWEGLCGNCGLWVGLVTSKKRGTTWFRHVQKCYKAENPLKRPRESEDGRSSDAFSESPKLMTSSRPESGPLGYLNPDY